MNHLGFLCLGGSAVGPIVPVPEAFFESRKTWDSWTEEGGQAFERLPRYNGPICTVS